MATSSNVKRYKKARARVGKRHSLVDYRKRGAFVTGSRKPHRSRKRQTAAYKGIVGGHQAGRRCTARVSGRQCFRTARSGASKCSSHSRRRKTRKVRGRTGRTRKRKVAKRKRAVKKKTRRKKTRRKTRRKTGRKRKVYTGSRGGKYIRRGGRKVYSW